MDFDQTITFTVKVFPVTPGPGTPTGTVIFMDGTTVRPSSPYRRLGDYATGMLSVGSHGIKAVYTSDSNFDGNTSELLNETIAGIAGVGPRTSDVHKTKTVLTAKPKSSTVGHVVTLTAKVSNQRRPRGIPMGSVTFYDGSIVLRTVTVTNGMAFLPTTSFHLGTNRIRATYIPIGSFQASKSGILVVKITSGHSKKKTAFSAIIVHH